MQIIILLANLYFIGYNMLVIYKSFCQSFGFWIFSYITMTMILIILSSEYASYVLCSYIAVIYIIIYVPIIIYLFDTCIMRL